MVSRGWIWCLSYSMNICPNLGKCFVPWQTDDSDKIGIYSYKVQSTITSRLASTMIQSKVVNNAKHPQHLVFEVQIPKGAFIDNFTM